MFHLNCFTRKYFQCITYPKRHILTLQLNVSQSIKGIRDYCLNLKTTESQERQTNETVKQKSFDYGLQVHKFT